MTSRGLSGIALAARLSALFATSFFLIATSDTTPPPGNYGGSSGSGNSRTIGSSSSGPCAHAYQSVVYHVTGTCGPEGDVILTSLANDCAISVQGGGDVGLPSAGRFSNAGYGEVSLTASTWVLSGYMPEGSVLPPTKQSDADPFIVVGAPQPAGTTGANTTVGHGSLVKRTCRNGSGGAVVSMSCEHDSSVAGCQATLTWRK